MVYMSIAKYIHSQVDNDGEYIPIGVYVHSQVGMVMCGNVVFVHLQVGMVMCGNACMSTHKWEWYTYALLVINVQSQVGMVYMSTASNYMYTRKWE